MGLGHGSFSIKTITMNCPHCESSDLMRNGVKNGTQNYQCRECKRYFADGSVSKPKKTKMGISLNDFRKKHDVVFILSQVFEKLGDDIFYEKSDIIKMSGLSPGYPGIGTVLDSENFKKYKGRAGSVDYWAKPELIEKLKEEGIIR